MNKFSGLEMTCWSIDRSSEVVSGKNLIVIKLNSKKTQLPCLKLGRNNVH